MIDNSKGYVIVYSFVQILSHLFFAVDHKIIPYRELRIHRLHHYKNKSQNENLFPVTKIKKITILYKDGYCYFAVFKTNNS